MRYMEVIFNALAANGFAAVFGLLILFIVYVAVRNIVKLSKPMQALIVAWKDFTLAIKENTNATKDMSQTVDKHFNRSEEIIKQLESLTAELEGFVNNFKDHDEQAHRINVVIDDIMDRLDRIMHHVNNCEKLDRIEKYREGDIIDTRDFKK